MRTTTQEVPVLKPGQSHDGGSVLRVIGTGYHPETGARFGIGAVKEGDEARKVQDGPMVPGPWAYAYGLCAVIDNHGGTKAESDRMQESGQEVTVQIGDVVEVDGHRYTVQFSTTGTYVDRHNIVLVAAGEPFVQRLRKADEVSGQQATVAVLLPDEGSVYDVDVWGPEVAFGGDLGPARVGWASIGSVSAADTAAYGRLLTKAAEVAERLRGPVQ